MSDDLKTLKDIECSSEGRKMVVGIGPLSGPCGLMIVDGKTIFCDRCSILREEAKKLLNSFNKHGGICKECLRDDYWPHSKCFDIIDSHEDLFKWFFNLEGEV